MIGSTLRSLLGRDFKAYKPRTVEYHVYGAHPAVVVSTDPYIPQFPHNYLGVHRNEAGEAVAEFAQDRAVIFGGEVCYGTESLTLAAIDDKLAAIQEQVAAIGPKAGQAEGWEAAEMWRDEAKSWLKFREELAKFETAEEKPGMFEHPAWTQFRDKVVDSVLGDAKWYEKKDVKVDWTWQDGGLVRTPRQLEGSDRYLGVHLNQDGEAVAEIAKDDIVLDGAMLRYETKSVDRAAATGRAEALVSQVNDGNLRISQPEELSIAYAAANEVRHWRRIERDMDRAENGPKPYPYWTPVVPPVPGLN